MTLLFYSDSTILRMIDNCAPFVEKIYIGYSEVPWTDYNKASRSAFKSTATPDILKDCKWNHKIEVIQGVWPSDEAERNELLDRARQDGMDYVIVQDADEFYHPEELQKNIDGIKANPDYPVYRCPWTVFFKTTDYVLKVRPDMLSKPTTVTTCPNFAVNCRLPDVHFSWTRLANRMDEAFMLPGLCLHLAWVLDDGKVWMKVQTWGHSHQFDGKKWYRHKWLAWKPSSRYIGHITRFNYVQAVPFTGKLPKELIGFPAPKQQYVPLTFVEKIDCLRLDLSSAVWEGLKIIKARTKHRLAKLLMR